MRPRRRAHAPASGRSARRYKTPNEELQERKKNKKSRDTRGPEGAGRRKDTHRPNKLSHTLRVPTMFLPPTHHPPGLATSNGTVEGLENREGGVCKSRAMKVIMKVGQARRLLLAKSLRSSRMSALGSSRFKTWSFHSQ
ncbi:unnamed protein product [Menidia menidia]|uniref:(Atlantic silverside) hypothetical protein n=1 Tax=Menidia menidia TaxID=238744 RepID=A0A8S4BMC1_9TELE|nr:unnamed protein product [Menidia menidia]